jgi:hypothetical protein
MGKATFRKVTYREMFTERQMLRLTLLRWLYRRGRLTEWTRN